MAIVRTRGLGGGGSLYGPRISPHDSNLMFVACDMTGLYRSADSGRNWTMLDEREVRGSIRFSVAFNPNLSGHVIAFNPTEGLMESTNRGITWAKYSPAPPVGVVTEGVTAVGFPRDGSGRMLVGTTTGVYLKAGAGWNPNPVHHAPVPTTEPKVSSAYVISFVFLKGRSEYFAATVDNILMSTDQGQNWVVISDETSNGLKNRPHGAFLPQDGSPPSRIRGFAGATKLDAGGNPQYHVLYATVLTDQADISTQGGVYRCDLPSMGSPPSSFKWNRKMNGLIPQAGVPAPRYEHLGIPDDNPDIAYVTSINFVDTPGTHWVQKGTFGSPQTGAKESWQGVYDGFQNHAKPPLNVTEPGWIEEHEKNQNPPRLGWGFGGPANSFAVDPKSAQKLIFVNTAFVHVTEDGATTWVQRYSQKVRGSLANDDDEWRSTGLDVTTVWHYYVPWSSMSSVHLLAQTDIGLARSTDGGDSWFPITRDTSGTEWKNWYEIAFDGTSGDAWAAVSDHHDYPHEKDLKFAPANVGKGAVLFSSDSGKTWTPYAPGLPVGPAKTDGTANPVVSLVYHQDTLYASLWGHGVFRSTPDPTNPVSGTVWQPVGGQFPNDSHNYRIRFDPNGNLYCIVAASLVGGVNKPGGLYFLSNNDLGNSSAVWEKRSGGLEELLKSQNPPNPNRKLAPMDFELHPTNPDHVYLCAADIEKSNGGGGLYKLDLSKYQAGGSGINGWSELPVPFKSKNYWNTLQAFAPASIDGKLFVTSTSHGTWCSTDEQNWTEYSLLEFLPTQRVRTTSDKNTGLAPLRVLTFGGGAWEVLRQCYFIVDRSVLSREEVSAVLGGGASATFEDALFVVFDGFLPIEITGKANPTKAEVLTAAPQVSAASVGVGQAQGFSITPTDALLEVGPLADGTLPSEVAQRFTFIYKVEFQNTSDFPPVGGATDRFVFGLETTKGALGCRARLALTTQPAPYMLDGPTPWLSTDLRVFKVREGEAPVALPNQTFPTLPTNPTLADIEQAASAYIKGVISNMNNAGFESIKGGADQDVLRWSTSESMKRVFNFAVARVRYRAQTQPANNVRVFFRLFKTAATGFDYDPNTSYRRSSNVPRLGWRSTPQGNEIVTIPCFAEPRVETISGKPGATSMDNQQDPANEQSLSSSGAEAFEFYGCWLDFNQDTLRFPDHPTNDGPYSGTLKSIQTLVHDQHQCLVAEIHFPLDPNQPGDTPGTSDNLAQRNLAIDFSANPGSAATRTVRHSFEIRASEAQPQTPNIGVVSFEGEELDGSPPWRDWRAGDELLIRWGNLPQASRVTLYMPERFINQILTLAKERGDTRYLERVDANTLRLKVIGEIAYIALPPARAADTPALFTVELPEGVRDGQHFSVLIQQTSARAVIGTFELFIPVREAEELLLDEERKLALLRHVVGAISPEDRWAPILRRSVELAEERVEDFGGDPDDILPSPDGAPRDTFAYDFSGFSPPIDNLPEFNEVNAGRTIPVKFSLGGDQGLEIFAPGYPKSQAIVCDSTDLTKGTEPTTSSSKLTYDPREDQYTYTWKTDKGWAKSCRQLVVKLRDGSFHRANFQFR